MNFPFYIARRYLLAKKSTNAINIISAISVLGIFIGSAALIIILSVFNGFEGVVLSLYNSFTPQLKITPVNGKTFSADDPKLAFIKGINEISYCVETLEEKALLRYDRSQYIATVKGVNPAFMETGVLDTMIIRGEGVLEDGDQDFAIIGRGVEYALSLHLKGGIGAISMFSPKRKTVGFSLDPGQEFTQLDIFPSGVFSVQPEFDGQYVIVPLRFARQLFQQEKGISAMELHLQPGTNVESLQKKLQKNLGGDFVVKNRYQQNELLYKVLNSEKWAVYLILTFVLLIAICNIIGSLTMLVIDKRKDIEILKSMGAADSTIRRIFMIEGMMISLVGAVAGLILGGLFCWAQAQFGMISMGTGESSMIHSYPVEMKVADFFLVAATVFVMAFIASWFTSKQGLKKSIAA